MSLKTHKIPLRETPVQREWFFQQSGYARFSFNTGLAMLKRSLDAGTGWLSKYDLRKVFNALKKTDPALAWTKDMDQRAAAYAFENLGDAIERYHSGQNGFPKFKKRGRGKQSYAMEGAKVRVEGDRIRLPKIGWIKMHEPLRFEGVIKKVTVSRTAHRWFVSIVVDTGTPTDPRDTRGLPVIGIDVGINTLATLDEGTKYENPRPLKQLEHKLARERRRLSRKVYQSRNWYKQKLKVERIHYRIACIRLDARHKATTAILKKCSAIGIETLKVKNLMKNRKVAKALADSSMGAFLSMLKAKAIDLSIEIVAASQFFASSKTCSSCDHKKNDLTLADRQYVCGVCDFTADRDVNAAINLRHMASGLVDM